MSRKKPTKGSKNGERSATPIELTKNSMVDLPSFEMGSKAGGTLTPLAIAD